VDALVKIATPSDSSTCRFNAYSPAKVRTPSPVSTSSARSRIVNPNGTVVFENEQRAGAGRVVAGRRRHPGPKVLPPAGLPAALEAVAEDGVPEWLRRSKPCDGDPVTGHEIDARQVFRRLAGCWTYWGWKGTYFSSERDARAFFDESASCWLADGRPELAAVVQHRPALGVRHRRPPQGHYLSTR